jgi:hypothetical protein
MDLSGPSVLINDDELKTLVYGYISTIVSYEWHEGEGRSWVQIVEDEQDDDLIMLIERLRIAYVSEVNK